jgi:signal transduction histidine kinase
MPICLHHLRLRQCSFISSTVSPYRRTTHWTARHSERLNLGWVWRLSGVNRLVDTTDTVESLRLRLDQCEQALQRCEQLAVASRYAGAVMHEVNNPLAAIANLVFLTKLQAANRAQVLENMDVIETQLLTLGNVTRRVLAFHRDQGEATESDLIEIVESALKLHSERLLSSKVSLRRDFRGPAIVSVFGGEILQLISNLLLNALEALPSEQPKLCVRVQARPNAVHITVSDNGTGMPSHVRKTLFEPYVTTKQTGTGLGLWLSQRIVDKHRGRICVRTSQREGRRGTTFRLSWSACGQRMRN